MKYMSIKYKHKYNKRQTRKTFRGGSNEDDRLEDTIKSTTIIKKITSKDPEYPLNFVDYNVLLPNNANKELTVDEFVKSVLRGGDYMNADDTLNIMKLDDQILNDMNRMILRVGERAIYSSFKEKVENDIEFFNSLSELKKDALAKIPSDVFFEKLKGVFPSLSNEPEEIKSIENAAISSEIWTNYWGILPYYDNVLLEKQLNNETVNKIKAFSQQNIPKTMIDILTQFVSKPSIFHYSLNVAGSFTTFGEISNQYINKINPALHIDVAIKSPTNIIIQNKVYFSLINVENEFGLAVISTCVYSDFEKNRVFLLWKIERWRNSTIKRFYHWVVERAKKTLVSENLLVLMQRYMYNNNISDYYPTTHNALLDYFITVYKYIKGEPREDVLQNAVTYINEMIQEKLRDNTSDADLASFIKNETQGILTVGQLIHKNVVQAFAKPDEKIVDTSAPVEEVLQQGIEQQGIEEQGIEEQNEEQGIQQQGIEEQGLEQVQQDEQQIVQAQQNLDNARNQYDRDHITLQENNPTKESANKLALAGSMLSLGAIGTGLYYAAPLLLGGENQNKGTKKKALNGTRKRKQ
jgi:hypothetical protein